MGYKVHLAQAYTSFPPDRLSTSPTTGERHLSKVYHNALKGTWQVCKIEFSRQRRAEYRWSIVDSSSGPKAIIFEEIAVLGPTGPHASKAVRL